MSEGGYLPWKRTLDSHRAPYFRMDDVHKPLPAPPKGFSWVRDAKGNYELREDPCLREMAVDEEKSGDEVPDYVDHVVVSSDTLAGLSLKYGVHRREIRRANNFEGDNVRTREVMRIPLGNQKQGGAMAQEDTLEVRTQRFRNATRLGAIEARIYLEAAEYDVDKAIAAAKEDDIFEEDALLNAKLAAPVETCKAHDSALKQQKVKASVVEEESLSLVVHLDRASDLRDAGVLASMQIYVVAALWAGADRIAEGYSCAVPKTDKWRWLPTEAGSTIDLKAPASYFTFDHDLTLTLHIKTKNDVLSDGDVGSSKSLPLSRLADGAINAIGVDTGGEILISITAPPTLPRNVVRAVAVRSPLGSDDDENPFVAADASALDDPIITAVAVRVDDHLHPPHQDPSTES